MYSSAGLSLYVLCSRITEKRAFKPIGVSLHPQGLLAKNTPHRLRFGLLLSCFGALDEKGRLAGPKPAVGKGFSAEGLAASLYSQVRQNSGLRGWVGYGCCLTGPLILQGSAKMASKGEAAEGSVKICISRWNRWGESRGCEGAGRGQNSCMQ